MTRITHIFGKAWLALALAIALPACNGFLDVNQDPTRLGEDQVDVSLLLPTTIEALARVHYSLAYTASQVTHQMDAFGGYYGEFTNSSAWSTIYLKGMNNLKVLEEKALAQGEEYSPHYGGVAKILEAMYVGLLTTTWENVPYSEALKGSENVQPAYDAQPDLYNRIQALLDEGLALLDAETSYLSPGSDDLAYGGDLDKWKRLAHSLKARYMLHLSNKGADWNAILSEAAQGLASNDDNFQLFYSAANPNPWFTNVAKANETGNFSITHASYFINLLKGEIYPVVDPRLPLIAALRDGDTTYIGEESWNPDAPESTVLLTKDTWYSTEGAPILMMTFAESKFIEAEAAFQAGDMDRAAAAYQAGIAAHMDMLGVDPAQRDAYMSHPAVSTVDLERIMMQKYIALFLHQEAWTDMRRYHFDPNVFRGFVEPDYLGRNQPGQRARYPVSEETRNTANVEANRKDFTTPMWFAE